MIIVDTNIISEVMKPVPTPRVIKWLNAQNSELLYVTTISIAEIRFGLHVLPSGKRRTKLTNLFEEYVNEVFGPRILAFTKTDTVSFAKVMGKSRKVGHGMSFADGLIAAIAKSNKAGVATRNAKDFMHCGIEIINPFDHP